MGSDFVIPVFGMITGMITTSAIVWGIVQIVRIRSHGPSAGAELFTEVAALRDQVEALQQQLLDAQERIDFAERLLTQGRDTRETR
ncbi:MAG TPA: hypothetical protein VH879_07960 [Gemmatimonadales bacterium]